MTVALVATGTPDASSAFAAMAGRFRAIGDAFGLPTPACLDPDPGLLLEALVQHAARTETLSETWLLLVGLTGRFPSPTDVREVRRTLELRAAPEAIRWLLGRLQLAAIRGGSAQSGVELATDRALVDVNVSVRWPYLTGVQRVVRETARLWQADHDVELVVWNDEGGGYRRLTERECARITDPDAAQASAEAAEDDGNSTEIVPPLIVPWGAPVICLEVPYSEHSAMLAAVAEFSPSPVRMVGYDCIPAASADLVPDAEPEKFGRYIEVAKWAERIAAISHSAAEEFRGLALGLSVQGLPSPVLSACVLPTETEIGRVTGEHSSDVPIVVSVGTLGPRKNQLALLVAAELLWREGLEFEVRLFGHRLGAGQVLTDMIDRLQDAGRRLVSERRATDDEVAQSLAEARCVVFASLHEGFGLPVVEALSAGTPVVTSNHGSLREIGEGGGTILVDAEDARQIADAMRQLLTDDELHARLVAEARGRPVRTWQDYSEDLWRELGS